MLLVSLGCKAARYRRYDAGRIYALSAFRPTGNRPNRGRGDQAEIRVGAQIVFGLFAVSCSILDSGVSKPVGVSIVETTSLNYSNNCNYLHTDRTAVVRSGVH